MASIDMPGERGGGRDLNRDLPLLPFIDFLLCLIAFLLMTAIWVKQSQIDMDARVPGQFDGTPPPQPKTLHVEVRDNGFQLVWKQGATVISSNRVERRAIKVGDDVRYPELARRIAEEWQAYGEHRAPGDPRQDRAVVHTSNTTEFGDVVAVLDAIRVPSRDRHPAFSVRFSAN